MLIKIGICDDEIYSLIDVKEKIKKYKSHIEHEIKTSIFRDVTSLLLECDKFDVIFLDIFIGNENGFEIMEEIMHKNSEVRIIIISNYSEYQYNALHYHSFDYLAKPVEYDEIVRTLNDVIQLQSSRRKKELYFEYMNRNENFRVKYSDIFYFEYSNKCTILKTKTEKYTMRISVKDIKLKLDIKQFIIPHQSFIVNPRYIMLIKNFEIKMSDGDIIPISQLQKSAVVEAFKKYTLGE